MGLMEDSEGQLLVTVSIWFWYATGIQLYVCMLIIYKYMIVQSYDYGKHNYSICCTHVVQPIMAMYYGTVAERGHSIP